VYQQVKKVVRKRKIGKRKFHVQFDNEQCININEIDCIGKRSGEFGLGNTVRTYCIAARTTSGGQPGSRYLVLEVSRINSIPGEYMGLTTVSFRSPFFFERGLIWNGLYLRMTQSQPLLHTQTV
jgi:hypothetical protein